MKPGDEARLNRALDLIDTARALLETVEASLFEQLEDDGRFHLAHDHVKTAKMHLDVATNSVGYSKG